MQAETFNHRNKPIESNGIKPIVFQANSQTCGYWSLSSFPPLTFTRTERTTADRLNDQVYLASTCNQFNKQIKASIFKSQTQVTCLPAQNHSSTKGMKSLAWETTQWCMPGNSLETALFTKRNGKMRKEGT